MRYIRFQIFKVGKLFYTATDNWGTPKFNEANVALRTVVKEATPKAIETLRLE
jgi:hypothetical protein